MTLYNLILRFLVVTSSLCWLLVILGVIAMTSGQDEAVNMVIGVGIWAVVNTGLLIAWVVKV